MNREDDLHALRLERKWWLHRAAQVQARIDVLEFTPPLPGDAVVVFARAGCAEGAAVGVQR